MVDPVELVVVVNRLARMYPVPRPSPAGDSTKSCPPFKGTFADHPPLVTVVVSTPRLKLALADGHSLKLRSQTR